LLNINSRLAQLFKKNAAGYFNPLYYCRILLQAPLKNYENRGKHTMMQLKNFAVVLAHRAGELLMQKLDESPDVQYKGDINLVTEADKASENLIMQEIRRTYPDHGILSEESPAVLDGSPLRWIIDPLDGTTNYAHGYPVFCVSIALEKDGLVIMGVIYDPTRGDTFVAIRGKGGYLNGKKLAVSRTSSLNRSLLATGFPYDIRESEENNLNYFSAMSKKAQAIRRAGAAALDIAYVAAGRFDGFWELKLKPWDTAAACLLIEETGGKITDICGRPWTLLSPHLLVSNGLIHEQMLAVFRKTAAV